MSVWSATSGKTPAGASAATTDRRSRIEGIWPWFIPLILVLLVLPAVAPLLPPGFPETDDGGFHVSRIIELRDTLSSGQLFPRWAQPFASGLGFPIFSFYAPLSYHLALFIGLFGFGDADCFKLSCALVIPLAALAMYWWMTRLLGHYGASVRARYAGAMVAGIAYGYTPYFLTNLHLRASLAEALAMAMVPPLLAAFDEILWRPRLSAVPFAAMVLSALVLAHNATAVLGFGIAAGYIVFRAATEALLAPASAGQALTFAKRMVYCALAVGLGLGISAFFWAPALLERGYLPGVFEQMVSGHFNAVTRLQDCWPPLQTSFPFDFSRSSRFRIGLVQILMVLPGLAMLVVGLRHRLLERDGRRPGASPAMATEDQPLTWSALVSVAAFLTLAMVLIVFLLSPASASLWGNMPLMNSMQFPWRTLSVFAVCGAGLAGIGLCWIGSRWPRACWPIAAAVIVVTITSSAISLPTKLNQAHPLAIGGIYKATSASGWDLPNELPTGQTPPEEALALTNLRVIANRPGRMEFEVEASQTTTVRLHSLYFPGWKVYVDGQEVPASPQEHGLLGFPVSKGRHSVVARFENTPLRTAAEATSILAGLVFLALLAMSLVRYRAGKAAALATFLVATVFVAPRLAASEPPPMESHTANLPPSSSVRLLGVGVEQTREDVFGLTLYWQALEPLGDWQSFVALVNERGEVIGEAARQPLEGYYGTMYWQTGEIIADRVELERPDGFSTDNLRLKAGFRPVTADREEAPVAFFDLPLSDSTASLTSGAPIAVLGDQLELAAGDLERRSFAPGEDLSISLLWRSLDKVSADTIVFVHLLDSSGRMWAQANYRPGPSAYPALLWSVGERVREERRLVIPQDAPAGQYTLRLGGYSQLDLRRLPIAVDGKDLDEGEIVIGDISVAEPKTRLTEVAPQHALRANFGDQLELVGFDLSDEASRPGEEVTVTTYWRALRPLSTDYTFFIHLLDSTGTLRAQCDGPPAYGQYPTSHWQMGEYVADEKTLDIDPGLPAGDYRLFIGLYEWPSLNRLLASVEGREAGNLVELGVVKVRRSTE